MENNDSKTQAINIQNIKENPYGLTRIVSRSSKENIVEDQTTPFDSFVNEDALRYYLVKSTNELEKMLEEMESRYDEKTKLYEVTFADKTHRYYEFATMLNRLTNSAYARKVFKQVKILSEYTKFIRAQYTKTIQDNDRANSNFDSSNDRVRELENRINEISSNRK